MDKGRLRQVLLDQQELFNRQEQLIERKVNLTSALKGKEIIVITGIRRCGKSSLLKLIARKISGAKLYLNFDDVRFTDFSVDNFQDVQNIAVELFGKEGVTYFLDEVQYVEHWERWVNNLYSQDFKVFLTGSNSNLLSSEIATHLTGRNKVLKLFPFSFEEYLHYKMVPLRETTSTEQSLMLKHFHDYLEIGGFPLVVKTEDLELSRQYFEDILTKDLLNRYHIIQAKEIKDLLVYLVTNVGKTYSYATLKVITGIKSFSTIKNYIDYCRNTYLIYTLERFDYSLKKQKISSSKPYVADISFLKTVAFNFTENKGKKLENLAFLQLLRRNKQVFYHLHKKECDFVVKEGLKITQVIQVAADVEDPLTKKREVEGLLEAMHSYTLKEGMILTLEKEEHLKQGEMSIYIKPLWKWLLEE